MAEKPAVDVPGIDKYIFAELCRWCREGNLEKLRDALYYEEGILNYFTVRTTKGNTLLHEAVDGDQPDVIQLLVSQGVSPDVRGKNNQTPLHLAAAKGHVLCLQVLLEGGADLTAEDDVGHTALSKAERSKRRDEILRLLRSKGTIEYLTPYRHIFT